MRIPSTTPNDAGGGTLREKVERDNYGSKKNIKVLRPMIVRYVAQCIYTCLNQNSCAVIVIFRQTCLLKHYKIIN